MRVKRVVIAALLVLLLGTGLVSAHEFQQGDQCAIEADRTVTGNLFVLCRSFILDGRVTGNVLGAATSAVINGTIDGDLYMIAGQMDLRGTIGDDAHFAGAVLRVHDTVTMTDDRSDLLTASLSTVLMPEARIPGSVLSVGYQLQVRGNVGDELSFWGSSLLIEGEIGGDVDAQVGDSNADVSQLEALLIPVPLDISLIPPGLRVREGARIHGLLRYAGPTEGDIAPGTLDQEPLYQPVVVQPDFSPLPLGEPEEARDLGLYVSQVVREALTLLVVGVAGLLLLPRTLQAPLRNLQERPLVCLGVGLLSFIVSFVVIVFAVLLSILVIIAISLIQVTELTLSVATLLTVIDVGGASFIFIVVIFVSRVIVCLAIGRLIARLLLGEDTSIRRAYLALAIGALVLAVAASLPVVGWVVNALAAFLGLGAIITLIQARATTAREMTSKSRYVGVTPPVLPGRRVTTVEESRPMPPPPPPITQESPRPLGMDNLPEGFTWWDD